MRNLSYSSLKLLRECPACFWWHVKHRIGRSAIWGSHLPNIIESKILEKFLPYRTDKKLPPELDIAELKDFRLIDQETHKKWKNPFSGEPGYKDLDANPDDILINGKKLIVIDYKTSGKSNENCTKDSMLKDIEEYDYKLQLEIHNYVLRKLGYDTEDYGYILFYFINDLYGDNNLKLGHELVRVDLDINRVEELLNEAREILKSDTPPNCRCEFCSSHQQRYEDKLKEQEEQEKIMENMH